MNTCSMCTDELGEVYNQDTHFIMAFQYGLLNHKTQKGHWNPNDYKE